MGGVTCSESFMIAAWAALLILILYLWADVREILGIVKDTKRELLRSSLSARAGESFPKLRKRSRGSRSAGQENAAGSGDTEKK